MVNKNAQEWLDEKYPVDGTCQRNNDSENKGKSRAGVTHLDIRKSKVGNFFSGGKTLVENLKLEGFVNLRTLIISSHQLIELDVSDCPNLEELDCHGNELNSLNVNGCSKLKKIDCLNNNLNELDLTTCPKLEEVNINNCFELIPEAIKSNLTYNLEKGKLVKDDSKVKNGPQITKAQENNIRNILIIGMTGGGKSALANVLADTGKFIESSSSTSVTKNFQESEVFEWKVKKYRIIDNIGFGDTNNISKEDILFKIGDGIHTAKEGINQVLFVFKDRFSPEHKAAFNLFKDFINETGITKFTTLVRTNFPNFRKQEKCQEDKNSLLDQGQEVIEIIKSCNGIIYVDNPAIPEEEDSDNEGEIEINQTRRKDSRKIVLDHLAENCPEIYKLKEWDSISSKVENYVKEKEKIEKSNSSTKEEELKKLRSEVSQGVNRELEANIGVNVPGLPFGFNAGIKYVFNK